MPNLRPLRVAVLMREAGSDFEKRLCQYETGGGMCRDKTCNDLHIDDLQPDGRCTAPFIRHCYLYNHYFRLDHETARYLLESMPRTLKSYDESEVADQLLQARQKHKSAGTTSSEVSPSLEDIVSAAVVTLVGPSS